MKQWTLLLTFIAFTMSVANAQFVEAQQCIGGSGEDIIIDIQKTADSGVIVLVYTTSRDGDFAGGQDSVTCALIKFNRNHEIEWRKTMADSASFISSVALSQYNSDLYLRYISAHTGVYFPVQYNLVKMDAAGNELWHKKYDLVDSSSGSSIVANYYQFNSTRLNELRMLRNNTMLVSIYKDTSVVIHSLDMDGNERWNKKFDYDTIFSSFSGSYFYLPPIINGIMELNDSSLLIVNSMYSYCFWFCNEYLHKTHIVKMDYEGQVLQQNLIDTAIYFFNSTMYEDSNWVYLYNFSNTTSRINKNNMSYEEMSIFSSAPSFLSYSSLFNPSVPDAENHRLRYPLYLITESDSLTQTRSNSYLILYDLMQRQNVYRTLLDTGYVNVQSSFLIGDKDYILIYAKDNTYYITRINEQGNIVYNKLLSSGILSNEQLTNSSSFPNGNYFTNLNMFYANLSVGQNDKLYTWSLWQKSDTSSFSYVYTQRLMVHNTETGELEFEYLNDMRDSLLFKYVAPYPDGSGNLFVLSDLEGSRTCGLGGFDIQLSTMKGRANSVYGTAYVDYNNNHQYDSTDIVYNTGMLESSKGSNSTSHLMYGQLFTRNFVDTGAWTTRLHLNNDYFSITPSEKVTDHADYNHADTVIFALYPKLNVHDLSVSLVNTFVTRLGRTADYEISYRNLGTYTVDGTLQLILDRRLQYVSAEPAISSQSGDTLIWNFTNLKLNEARGIRIKVNALTPPELNAGDTIRLVAMIAQPGTIDTTPADNVARLNEVIRAAIDPNDKYTTTGDDLTKTQIDNGEYITYVVRFQNVGDDTAFRVVILDTLDANLDWSTFEVTNASHLFSVEVLNKHILKFTSKGMVLPYAAVGGDASHGFIAYKVKPKPTLAQGSTIKNTAHIYFDFNAPVTTNTVQTHVLLLSAIGNHMQGDAKVRIYPNPNNGIFNLEFLANYTSPLSVTLFDLTGKMVYQKNMQHSQKSILHIDTNDLPAGLYSVALKTDKEERTEKIIIEK